MGIKLVEEVMDHAPDTLTTGEWKGLIVLARDANDRTRITYNGVNSPEILRRVRLSVAAWSNLRSALIRKGVLEVVQAGVKGRTAMYRIPPLAPPILHPVDEESLEAGVDLHPTDEESDPTLHPTDEVSAGFFIQQVTPTPLSSPQGLLSPPDPDLAPAGTAAPSRERSESTNDPPTPVAAVIDAYAQALGRPVTNGTRAKLTSHAEGLLAAGYPAAWLADRAREMAPKGWIDLEQHAARSTVPLPGASRPAWCGSCDERTRMAEDADRHPVRCPNCHPHATPTVQQPTEQPQNTEPDDPADPVSQAFTFLTSLPAPWTPTFSAAARLNHPLARAVTALGWDYDDQLTKHLTEDHGDITDHAAALSGRILALAGTQTVAKPATPANGRTGGYQPYRNPVDQSVYFEPIS